MVVITREGEPRILLNILKGVYKMSDKKKVVKENSSAPKGHGPGSTTWGVRNAGKCANKYPKNWGQKGMKSNSNGSE
tara:strand:- start:25360 stop:25590 length:231 start_codon:yes stop_codon:yes gene_type:complete